MAQNMNVNLDKTAICLCGKDTTWNAKRPHLHSTILSIQRTETPKTMHPKWAGCLFQPVHIMWKKKKYIESKEKQKRWYFRLVSNDIVVSSDSVQNGLCIDIDKYIYYWHHSTILPYLRFHLFAKPIANEAFIFSHRSHPPISTTRAKVTGKEKYPHKRARQWNRTKQNQQTYTGPKALRFYFYIFLVGAPREVHKGVIFVILSFQAKQ